MQPYSCRTSFRTWAAERTVFPETIYEMVLAHEVGTDAEKDYRQSDLFDRGRPLMQHWAACRHPYPKATPGVSSHSTGECHAQ
jgi:hypothetical protein